MSLASDIETLAKNKLNLSVGLALAIVSLPLLLIYVLLVLSSFANRLLSGPDILEASYSLYNWRMFFSGLLSPASGKLFTTKDILIIIVNTLVVALGVMIVVVVASVMAGYAFSRIKFYGRESLMEFLILLHAFPGVALIIAVYAIYVKTLSIFPQSTLPSALIAYRFFYTIIARASLEIPMSIWLMKGFFDKIPWELEWSALVDGASRIRTWWKVLLPLVKPGIAALSIFSFLAGWEDLIYVHVFLYIGGIRTLATFIEETVGNIETAYLPVVAVAGTIYLLPTIVFFIATQRLLVEAMSGGVKA